MCAFVLYRLGNNGSGYVVDLDVAALLSPTSPPEDRRAAQGVHSVAGRCGPRYSATATSCTRSASLASVCLPCITCQESKTSVAAISASQCDILGSLVSLPCILSGASTVPGNLSTQSSPAGNVRSSHDKLFGTAHIH